MHTSVISTPTAGGCTCVGEATEARPTPTLGSPTGSPLIGAQSRSLGDLEKQKAYCRDVPPLYVGIVQRAFGGAASPRQAIKAKCLDCCGYQRDEVRHCQVVLCPLHAHRPYQQGGDADET